MESILTSIKLMLDYEESDTGFDPQIIMHINTALMSLTQIGVGPTEGFEIEDDTTTWQDFVPNMKKFSGVKSYIYMKVKLAFDSASMSSALITAYNEMIKELEWRLAHAAEFE